MNSGFEVPSPDRGVSISLRSVRKPEAPWPVLQPITGGAPPALTPYRRPLVHRLVLATATVARRRMMARAGIRFMVEPSRVDEVPILVEAETEGLDLADTALSVARAKAEDVSLRLPRGVIVAADTRIAIDGFRPTKPLTRQQAALDLHRLQGRTHRLVTGVSVWTGGSEVAAFSRKAVLSMRSLCEEGIEAYLDGAGPLALLAPGAYDLDQPSALNIVEIVSGDIQTALGLPIKDLLAIPSVAATQG